MNGSCRDDGPRREALRRTPLTGIDAVEVDERDPRRLVVHLIAPLGRHDGAPLTPANFAIRGGRRVRDIRVVSAEVHPAVDLDGDERVRLVADHVGDFSTYTLRVVATDERGRPTDAPHPAFDPVYACADFSFQAACPSPLDCAAEPPCPEPARERPAIDYLAKDFASFKALLLDRLRVLVPGFAETHEPDLTVALLELLAYEGDRLSYLQDAVATEAYLRTARRRVSVRRHARLVDHRLHEGCNARAFVHVEAAQDTPWLAYEDLFFLTGFPGSPAPGTVLSPAALRRVPEDAYEVFEPLVAPADRLAPGDPEALCRRVLEGEDPVARLLRARLPDEVAAALEAWREGERPAAEVAPAVLDALEDLARGEALQHARAFERHRDEDAPRRALRRPLRRGDQVRLNRLLVLAAFSEELAPPGHVRFLAAHNAIALHTWGGRECCLPAGATAATLVDAERRLRLQAGDLLVLEEVRGAATGLPEDADPAHRHVVRLTHVRHARDAVLDVELLEVGWAPEDALPFPLCLATRGPAPECAWFDDVSVARGNVLLCDHGRRRLEELDAVEVDAIDQPCDACGPDAELVPARYRPTLRDRDLTFAEPLRPGAPAAAMITRDPAGALPQLRLQQVFLAPPRLDAPDPLERYRNPPAATAFDPEDLLDPGALADRLQSAAREPGADAVADDLLGRLDGAGRAALEDREPGTPASDELVAAQLRALDAALADEGLATEERFARASLDPPTLELLDDDELPADLRRLLRRWLLEQALAGVLAPARRQVAWWTARLDLIGSDAGDRHFVAEITDERRAALRFGDGELGRRPEGVSRFRAHARTGNGVAGNVGAEAITWVAHRREAIAGLSLKARNPLPAVGGTGFETLDEARRRAPYGIRHELARAITADDYAQLAARELAPALQGAACELVWTGSWHEAHVSLDPAGGEDAPAELLAAARTALERYRRMGHALHVAPAHYVPLDIVLRVCVLAHHRRAEVRAALEDVFSSKLRADGTRGVFHPDELRFRSHVDVSDLVAAAQRVEGVAWCRVTRLQRLGEGDAGEVDAGTLIVGPGEIPRVRSRPGFPEDGAITFDLEGGR